MKYFKNFICSFKEIFLLLILQYLALFICFICLGEDKTIITGTILICIIQVIYIIYKYRKKNKRIEECNLFPYLLLGVGISCSYNMILFSMNLGNVVNTDINLVLNIICSGIIGPIFEEVLFRYSFMENLRKFNKEKTSIVISSVVFALCHTGITTIIYAFIIGLINSYLYVKKKNILIPIIIHISGNIFVNLITDFNLYILIIGLFLTILSCTIISTSKD